MSDYCESVVTRLLHSIVHHCQPGHWMRMELPMLISQQRPADVAGDCECGLVLEKVPSEGS